MRQVHWDPAITGMPYVSVGLWDSGNTTNSLLEAHRLNSPYIISSDSDFAQMFRSEAKLPERNEQVGIFDRATVARAAFKYDPGSVLHGVFLEKLDGRARLQRCLSGFIEAEGASVADSGGVKNDRVAPSPSALKEIGMSVGAAEWVWKCPVPPHRVHRRTHHRLLQPGPGPNQGLRPGR